ncbi:MAG: RNA methyltransferase [Acidobacteria bacterium]|uniref:RNA methyltransferase n=1 Tax=Candidatus Polarisedimenticola svalbardensis TaxID=2886004 RepID=A0A8J6Y7Z4_9BACT|nr:RNA methyltransferase [Candidatus Polarisedimenticola svalbardensis]
MNESRWHGVAEACRRLLAPAERSRSRKFILEGFRLHERAVRAGAQVEVVLIAESAQAGPSRRLAEIMVGLSSSGARLVTAPDEVVDELTGGRGGGPLVGIAPIPAEPVLHDQSDDATYLVAADVEDPGNVGAMIRTALAAGCTGFVAAGISDPYHPKAVRTSMGSLFRIPVIRYESSLAAVMELKRSGIGCIGAISRDGAPLHEAGHLWKGKQSALFLGSEARGLPEEVVEALDGAVTIPMTKDVDSFSVNAAAAIILYERFRGQGK